MEACLPDLWIYLQKSVECLQLLTARQHSALAFR